MARKSSKPQKKTASKAKKRTAKKRTSKPIRVAYSYTLSSPSESSSAMNKVVRFRVSETDQAIIQNAAIQAGLDVSEFLRQAALEKATGGEPFDHLEKKDDEWFYKGRKLKVFENYYYLSQTADSDQEWSDLYGLPLEAIKQAKRLCRKVGSSEYKSWVKYWEKEQVEDNKDGVQHL